MYLSIYDNGTNIVNDGARYCIIPVPDADLPVLIEKLMLSASMKGIDTTRLVNILNALNK